MRWPCKKSMAPWHHYCYSKRRMRRRVLCLLVLIHLGSGASQLLTATNFFVSPTGRPTGDGSLSNAWDLATAFLDNTNPTNKNYAVKPGDAVWVRGGIYGTGSGAAWNCTISGTSNQPVIIRQYPGERAVINGEIFAKGDYEIFWGFEMMNSAATNRICDEQVLTPGLSLAGVGARAINLVIHDVGAPGIWLPQLTLTNSEYREIYGCVMWGCGDYATNSDNPGGPGHYRGPILYMKNTNGIVSVADNIAFKSWTEGLKAYGQNNSADGFQFQGNITFLNFADGIVADASHYAINTLTVSSNYYCNNGQSRLGITFPLLDPSAGTNDQSLQFNSNYFLDEVIQTYDCMLWNRSWSYYTMTNNIFVVVASTNATLTTPYASFRDSYVFWNIEQTNMIQYVVDYNQYYGGSEFIGNFANISRIGWNTMTATYGWEAHGAFHTNTLPTANVIVLRTNKYERGRAHLIVYNWQSNSTINVDISNIGLAQGQSFEVRDVQNYLGTPALSATYDAAHPNITVPLTLTNVTPLMGIQTHFRRDPNVHTSSLFNTFVILPVVPVPDPPSYFRVWHPSQ